MRSLRNILFGFAVAVLLALSANTLMAGDGEKCVKSGSVCKDKGCSGVCGSPEVELGDGELFDNCWCLYG